MTIELSQVSKCFETAHVETRAVDDVSLHLQAGEILAITGASGSGKSTLAALIGLLERPTRGAITVNGQDITGASDSALARVRRAHIGFVFQAFHLVDHLTVRQNVALALAPFGVGAKASAAQVDAALESVGMLSRALHYPAQLSGGQQQRVAVARAIVREPTYLICDEPTGNLDESNAERVMTLLLDANARGAGLLIVTHDPAIALLANRRLHMASGKLAEPEEGPS